VEKQRPELLPNLSSARSPMQIFASVIKEEVSRSSSRSHVEVMACPGGCISGAGRPQALSAVKEE
jgi:NADH-quinone oxidoreductase subunit G